MEASCVLYEMQIESLYIMLINFSLQREWREGYGLLPVIRLSYLTIISPVRHNHIDLDAALLRTRCSNMGSFKDSCSENRKQ